MSRYMSDSVLLTSTDFVLSPLSIMTYIDKLLQLLVIFSSLTGNVMLHHVSRPYVC